MLTVEQALDLAIQATVKGLNSLNNDRSYVDVDARRSDDSGNEVWVSITDANDNEVDFSITVELS